MLASDTSIVSWQGIILYNEIAIHPQSRWVFVSHALARSTGPKGNTQKTPTNPAGVLR